MKSFYPKIVPKIALIFLFCFSISAQENCPPITQTADILLNLQLGMTIEEINVKLGKALTIKTKMVGDFRFFQNYIDKKPPKNLAGIRAIYLRFYERKLYQIEIFYDENKYPSDLNSITQIVSTQLNLPVSNWKMAHRQAVLFCGETSITVDYQLNLRVELTDEVVKKRINDLYKKAKPLQAIFLSSIAFESNQ